MNFEKLATEGESNKHRSENIKRMIVGAVLSTSALAGQSAEAQTTDRVEQREQLEMVASGILSQSNEVFTVEVKPGNSKLKVEGQKNPRFRDVNCEEVTVKIANEVFKCSSANDIVPRGPQLHRAMLTVVNEKGREITFNFIRPVDAKEDSLKKYEIPSDQQGNPVFYTYDDTKFSQVDGGIKYNTAGISSGRTMPGVFKLEGVQLQGVLAQYGLTQKK